MNNKFSGEVGEHKHTVMVTMTTMMFALGIHIRQKRNAKDTKAHIHKTHTQTKRVRLLKTYKKWYICCHNNDDNISHP